MAGRQAPVLGRDGGLSSSQFLHQTAIGSAGDVAEMAATHKSTKYGALESQYCFQPIALESLGPMNSDARQFLSDLGRRISLSSDDDRETSFLFQRISVLLFRKFHNNLDGTK